MVALGRLLERYGTDLAVEATYLCRIHRGAIDVCIDAKGQSIELSSGLRELTSRILDRDALLMIDDLDTDSVLEELALERPTGSFLGVGMFSDQSELLGVLLAHGQTIRHWTNRDLERASDTAQGLAAFLMLEQLRRTAQRRIEAEARARDLRSQMHTISAQAAYASTLRELSQVLVRETPGLLSASWAVVGYRHADSEWHVLVGETHEALLNQPSRRADQVDLLFDSLSNLVSRQQITAREDARWLLDEASGDDQVGSIVAAPLTIAEDLSMVLVCGFEDSQLDLQTTSVFDEMIGDVGRVVTRTDAAQRQIEAASTLQRSLLPPRVPDLAGYKIGRLYASAADHTRVGGDWYDIVQIDADTTAFVVGDVAGHDIRSAALMGQVRHVLASQLRDRRQPAGALAATDRYFADLAENVMATAVVMVVDRTTKILHVALAGHPPPVLITNASAVLLPVAPGPPIGFGLGSFRDATQQLSGNDTLIAYTDGVVEDRTLDLQASLTQFVEALDGTQRSVDELLQFLDRRSAQGELRDDVAALVVKIAN
jgi:GAF domain-containing protein